MGLTSTVCALFLLAVLLFSTTLDCAEASGVSKQDMCDSLRTLAGCISDSSCTINSDCTCVSFTAAINALITIPLTICIVDPCAMPVCFMVTSESRFSKTVCKDIDFTISQTITLGSLRIPVMASIAVRLVRMPLSKVQMTITATVAPSPPKTIASAPLHIYCPPPPPPSFEAMCSSATDLASMFSTGDTVIGDCTISETCEEISCDVMIQHELVTIPLYLSVTLLPCECPFAIYVIAEATLFGNKFVIANGTFSESTIIQLNVGFVSGTVTVTIIQQDNGILLSVSAVVAVVKFTLIESANLIMYCNATVLPPPPPTKNTSLEDMCTSVTELTNALSTGDTVTGTCAISDTCLDVNCKLKVTLQGGSLSVSLMVTLLPCQSPFAIYVKVDTIGSPAISIVDGTYSGSETIPVTFGPGGMLNVDIIQQDCGITLSVSGEVSFFGKFSLIENANITMHCPCR